MGWDGMRILGTTQLTAESSIAFAYLRQLMTTKERIDFLYGADTWRLEGCECGPGEFARLPRRAN